MAVEDWTTAQDHKHHNHHSHQNEPSATTHTPSTGNGTPSSNSSIKKIVTVTTTTTTYPSHSVWSGFYKKPLKDRQELLSSTYPALFTTNSPIATPSSSPSSSPLTFTAKPKIIPSDNVSLPSPSLPSPSVFPLNGLSEAAADNMIENCVGTLGLPVGLGLNFTINGVPTVVPMCIEEPSVIAAASGAAKTICSLDPVGFTASSSERNIVYAQIQLWDISDADRPAAMAAILDAKQEIISLGNQFCGNMAQRGGGLVDVSVRPVQRRAHSTTRRPNQVFSPSLSSSEPQGWLVVHLHIDVCDAMGANCASAVAEGTAPLLASLSNGRIGLRIVSNLCLERMATASFRIPVSQLAYKGTSGQDLAFRIVDANDWARSDPFRATTHNKGIMNGIDAVALATGQDWRAIEAAAHAYNALRSSADPSLISTTEPALYRPFTDYWVSSDPATSTLYLHGELTLPMPIATKGGVLKTNPVYSYTLGLLSSTSSQHLAQIMVSVGLAQNFAALRALCTEGIQRGHMSLHARNLAIAAGHNVESGSVEQVVRLMRERGQFNSLGVASATASVSSQSSASVSSLGSALSSLSVNEGDANEGDETR